MAKRHLDAQMRQPQSHGNYISPSKNINPNTTVCNLLAVRSSKIKSQDHRNPQFPNWPKTTIHHGSQKSPSNRAFKKGENQNKKEDPYRCYLTDRSPWKPGLNQSSWLYDTRTIQFHLKCSQLDDTNRSGVHDINNSPFPPKSQLWRRKTPSSNTSKPQSA